MKSTDRLNRLLLLVPYFLARPGISLNVAAQELGTTSDELRDDLQLLFVCGLPGYGPGDLIDMSLDEDSVTITYDAGMNRPLRLTSAEAIALLVALRALADVPGLAASDAVSRALAKIEQAAGPQISATAAGSVAVRTYAKSETMQAVSAALQQRHALQITYYSATRDAMTDRTVDPMRLVLAEGTAYLEAWCRSAQAVRLFRLDRIDALTELSEPANPPSNAESVDVRNGVFQSQQDFPLIQLQIGRAAQWVVEYYRCEQVEPLSEHSWRVWLRASDLEWAKRLVMSLGTDVCVLGPPELAQEITQTARAALAAYDQLQPVR